MRLTSSIVIPILVTYLLPTSHCGHDEDFASFLNQTMQSFGSWIRSKNLDPTPTIPYFVNLTRNDVYTNVTGGIWNQVVHGTSNFNSASASARLLQGQFDIGGFTFVYSAIGEYSLNGTLLATTPVSGDGRHIANSVDGSTYINLYIRGFDINSDGYISISNACVELLGNPMFWTASEFEGLSAGGFEPELTAILEKEYSLQVPKWVPLREYLIRYLEEVFEQTPISDIIGVGAYEEIRKLHDETTTSIPSTTRDPCWW